VSIEILLNLPIAPVSLLLLLLLTALILMYLVLIQESLPLSLSPLKRILITIIHLFLLGSVIFILCVCYLINLSLRCLLHIPHSRLCYLLHRDIDVDPLAYIVLEFDALAFVRVSLDRELVQVQHIHVHHF
jgi:hypothetical protein